MTKSTPTTFKFSWSTQQSHILEGLKSLAIGESSSSNAFLTDVTLACEGEYIEAHRLVLSLCSSFFKDLFYQNERISDKAHGIVILSHVSATDLRYILQFMYQGSVHIPKEHVDGFLQAGTLLKVEGLMSATGVAIGISDKAPRVTTPSSSSANPCPKSKKPSSPDVKPKKRRRKSSSVSGNGSDDDNEAHSRVEVNVKFERPFRDATSTPFDDNDDVEGLEEAEIFDDFGVAGGDSDVGGASEVDGSGDENEGASLNLPEPSANRLANQATVTPKCDDGSVVRAGGRRPKNEDASSSSDGGSSHSSDYHNPPPRKKPVRVNYVLSKSFPNLGEAKTFAKESKKWSPHYSRKMLNNSTKHHYHCRFVRDCPARMHLLESETGTDLYVADIEHPHPLNIVIKPYGMSDEVKAKINHLYRKGMTAPRSLLRRLKADGLGEPTKNQVTRYIQVTFKDKKKNVEEYIKPTTSTS